MRISIINLLGQEAMILLDESRMPGEQEVSFDASALKRGIYIVRMVSDKISGTRLVVR
jgi:hypothetical protein